MKNEWERLALRHLDAPDPSTPDDSVDNLVPLFEPVRRGWQAPPGIGLRECTASHSFMDSVPLDRAPNRQ